MCISGVPVLMTLPLNMAARFAEPRIHSSSVGSGMNFVCQSCSGKMPEAVGLQHLAVKSTKFHNPPMRRLPALRHDCGSNARRFR